VTLTIMEMDKFTEDTAVGETRYAEHTANTTTSSEFSTACNNCIYINIAQEHADA
jgi:hypothetical protein